MDVFSYFASQANHQGSVDTAYNQWADFKGPDSEECRRLGILFGQVIDAAKSGQKLSVPEELKNVPATSQSETPKIWQKLSLLSEERKREIKARRVSQCITEQTDAEEVSEEFVLDILDERQSNISEYDKLLFVWKFCQVKMIVL